MEIKLKDKVFPIEFNTNSLDKVKESTGINPFSGAVGDPGFVRALVFEGIKEAHRMGGQKFEMTIEDVGAMIGVADMLGALKLFRSTMPLDEGDPGEE